MNTEIIKAALVRDEGRRNRLYNDADGKPYISSVGKLTIGVGHNIEDRGLSNRIISLVLEEDIAECVSDLTASFPWFASLDEVRQHVMLNMRFQLGPARFRQFKKMLAAMERKDYPAAADSMRFSAWAEQVPNRAHRLIEEMRTGVAQP